MYGKVVCWFVAWHQAKLLPLYVTWRREVDIVKLCVNTVIMVDNATSTMLPFEVDIQVYLINSNTQIVRHGQMKANQIKNCWF